MLQRGAITLIALCTLAACSQADASGDAEKQSKPKVTTTTAPSTTTTTTPPPYSFDGSVPAARAHQHRHGLRGHLSLAERVRDDGCVAHNPDPSLLAEALRRRNTRLRRIHTSDLEKVRVERPALDRRRRLDSHVERRRRSAANSCIASSHRACRQGAGHRALTEPSSKKASYAAPPLTGSRCSTQTKARGGSPSLNSLRAVKIDAPRRCSLAICLAISTPAGAAAGEAGGDTGTAD